ncbi:hypothetical protein NKR23_g1341 [Pleurostoma richardsiae]|uniref:Mitochondrial outer membrane protein n=1 Tax=Pleurostoma richardsiae TaxID=41990 RepID=A0AA38VZR5_9PEZI|nr:hypothetical protein NKR23_g1341 [Pleurostoma richardsiae]
MTESRPSRWFSTRIPPPIQRLFDKFPLVTYPPNDLPEGSPVGVPGSLPTLHVFILEEDALKGRPSFNPSCLKWQTFLRIAGVRVRLLPSNNHASPSGALPFLQPASTSPDPASPAPASAPVPSTKLYDYALAHGSSPPGPEPASRRLEAYQALLDHPVRRAWLHALYLDPSHADLLARLYARPASRSRPVQAALLHQLRRAAAAEIAKADVAPSGSGGAAVAVAEEQLYARAGEALAALEALLGDGGAEWFFGSAAPTLFDAAVFAYTHLLLGGAGVEWGQDGSGGGSRLRAMVRDLPGLVAHRERIWARYWTDLG